MDVVSEDNFATHMMLQIKRCKAPPDTRHIREAAEGNHFQNNIATEFMCTALAILQTGMLRGRSWSTIILGVRGRSGVLVEPV